MTRMRFDPFRDVERLGDVAWGRNRLTGLAMDAYRRNDELVLEFDLPGVDPATIDLTVERNVLTVTAERNPGRPPGDEVIVSERQSGRFTRRLVLGDGLDTDRVHAAYVAGVLTLTFPVAAQVRARRIEVATGPAPEPTAIDAESTEGDTPGPVGDATAA